MEGKRKVLCVDDVEFTMKDLESVTKAMVADDQRLSGLPEKNNVYMHMIAAKDYANGMSCEEWLGLSYKIINDLEERAFVSGIICAYCEMRYRATRGHNEELANKYLDRRNAIMKDAFRTLKMKEKGVFLEALAA